MFHQTSWYQSQVQTLTFSLCFCQTLVLGLDKARSCCSLFSLYKSNIYQPPLRSCVHHSNLQPTSLSERNTKPNTFPELHLSTTTKMAISPPLNVGWGYGIVLGLGALFAFGMVNTPLIKTHKPHISNHHPRSSSRGSSSATTMSFKPPKCSVPRVVPLNQVSWLQLSCLPGLGPQLSCKAPLWLTSTVFRVLSGMLLELRSRFCSSPVLRLSLRDALLMPILSSKSLKRDLELLLICKSSNLANLSTELDIQLYPGFSPSLAL